jgi:hypothetical protein
MSVPFAILMISLGVHNGYATGEMAKSAITYVLPVMVVGGALHAFVPRGPVATGVPALFVGLPVAAAQLDVRWFSTDDAFVVPDSWRGFAIAFVVVAVGFRLLGVGLDRLLAERPERRPAAPGLTGFLGFAGYALSGLLLLVVLTTLYFRTGYPRRPFRALVHINRDYASGSREVLQQLRTFHDIVPGWVLPWGAVVLLAVTVLLAANRVRLARVTEQTPAVALAVAVLLTLLTLLGSGVLGAIALVFVAAAAAVAAGIALGLALLVAWMNG